MLRPCLECGTPTERTRCPTCTGILNRDRGSSAQRGYTNRWRRIRDGYIATHPLCEYRLTPLVLCGEPAQDVDHIRPLRAGGSHRRSNLQSLCRVHHAQKTRNDAKLWT